MILALTLACAALQEPAQVTAARPAAEPACPDPTHARNEDWQRIASDPDRARLRSWRDSWTAAAATMPAGNTPLFSPDRALTEALPPLGSYRCRLYHFGEGPRTTPIWAGCRVEEDKGRSRFVVEDGIQRAAGLFYRDTEARGVFLGTVTIGDEARPLRYGRDRLRDLAGFVERVDERRWRIVLPQPSFGGILDLIEMVPG